MIKVEQIRAARAMLGLKQIELARKAGISMGTLNNIERGVQIDPKVSTIRAIQQALEADGIEFIENDMHSFGVLFRTQKTPAESIRLLIIDDNASDRQLYKTWLSKQTDKKYSIFEAANAKDGYESFLNNNPSCILLDFMMYGKDGFQLLVEMKKEHTKIPPIIFLSASHDNSIKKDVLAMGVEYLDKKTLTKEILYKTLNKSLA